MFRRTTAVIAGITVFALTAFTTTSAGAEDEKLKSYNAGAYATALELTLLGQELAVSTTSSAINSTPKAAADGAALLLAGTPLPGAAPSAAPEGPASNEACVLDLDLAELTAGAISLAEAGLACVETAASAKPGETVATSASGELVINILAPGGTALQPILEPLFGAVEQVTDPLINALLPILGPVEDLTGIDLPAVLDGLLDDLQDQTIVLAQIAVAPTASITSATTAEGVLAHAASSGATIRVLPGLAPSLLELGLQIPALTEPLVTVKLGTSVAEVKRDPETGEADARGSVAQLLSIETSDLLGILEDLTGATTDLLDALSINLLGCNANNPLAGVLCIDLGVVNELDQAELAARNLDFGEGTVGRESSAATIRVLSIASEALGGDVLGLRLATSGAAAQAIPAEPVTTTTKARQPLPKTGAAPMLPLGLALLAGAATTFGLIRRTRTA